MSAFPQTSLAQALKLHPSGPGEYTIDTPRSLCFGTGGFITAVAHQAASNFLSTSVGIETHQDVSSVYTQFFRPTLPSPNQALLNFRVASSSKTTTVLQFDVAQKERLCLAGYITMVNLTALGKISMNTGWQLNPSPPPVSLEALEVDGPSNWSGYLTPFDCASYRKPQSYIRYYVPKERNDRHLIDQWVTPGWQDTDSPYSAVWTNATIHFVIDNALPILNDLLEKNTNSSTYEKIVNAGILQKEARKQRKIDRLWGEGLQDSEIAFPWIISTVSTSTDVKRLLPNEGCKWLFMRETVKDIVDGRLDLEIVLMNKKMELVAVSQHICQVVHVDQKRAKTSNL